MKKILIQSLIPCLILIGACKQKVMENQQVSDYKSSNKEAILNEPLPPADRNRTETTDEEKKDNSNTYAYASAVSFSDKTSPVQYSVTQQDNTKQVSNVPMEKKIIRSGDMHVEVKTYDKAHKSLLELCKKLGGYVENEQEKREAYLITNTMQLRVPAARFDELIAGSQGIASKVISKNFSAVDVTAQYRDEAVRMYNKKAVEAQYVAILKQAHTVQDILDVQEKIGEIRGDIESMEADLKSLDGQVSYSTLTLTLDEPISAPMQEAGFFSSLFQGMHHGWDGLLQGIIACFSIWPLWILLIFGIFIARFIIKRINRTIAHKA